MPNNEFNDLGFAKIDQQRVSRTGLPETVFAPGKTEAQLYGILHSFELEGVPVLATKCTPEQFAFLNGKQLPAAYDPVSRLLKSAWGTIPPRRGTVAVCTGGTADIPVAEEAAQTAEFFGVRVNRYFDVGIAGLHRLLSQIEAIRKADVVIAVAGMEGALAGVIAGLVPVPVIAVPTSVGYGASFQGIAPLLSMLNSCAEGISTVNIDNGFGAAVVALRILQTAERMNHE